MGQQIATRQLSERQAAFVEHLIETGDAPKAAQLAGFLDRPSREARRLLRIPYVLAALNAAMAAALAEDAPLARKLLRRYVEDEALHPT
jgi:phage terminase small subunit